MGTPFYFRNILTILQMFLSIPAKGGYLISKMGEKPRTENRRRL